MFFFIKNYLPVQLRQISLMLWIGLFLSILTGASLHAQPNPQLPTYFEYNAEELQRLSSMTSSFEMDKHELENWDSIAEKTVTSHHAEPSENVSRLFAYLYTAQREAAFLSYNSHSNFIGSLDAISQEVLKLFYNDFQTTEEIHSDDYSNYLAQIVMQRIKQRYDKENAQIKDYALHDTQTSWKPEGKPYGLSIGSWMPWFIKHNQFKAPSPPSAEDTDFWKSQAESVKKAQTNLTEKQKDTILFWAGKKGPGSGDWGAIVNKFLFNHNIPFAKVVLVRAVFSEAFCDTMIAVFDSKYQYQVKRPHMFDNTIQPFIPAPHHPSYPSGHSTTAGLTEVLLSHYFPTQSDYWHQLAVEAGQSRIWAGIHYPIDDQAGMHMGQQIAQEVSKMPKNNL